MRVSAIIDGVRPLASDGSHARGVRQGTYFHTEVPVHNNLGPIWLTLTNYALRTNAGPNGADLYTNETRQVFVPATPEVFAYDAFNGVTHSLDSAEKPFVTFCLFFLVLARPA
jgi:hypothetical protein